MNTLSPVLWAIIGTITVSIGCSQIAGMANVTELPCNFLIVILGSVLITIAGVLSMYLSWRCESLNKEIDSTLYEERRKFLWAIHHNRGRTDAAIALYKNVVSEEEFEEWRHDRIVTTPDVIEPFLVKRATEEVYAKYNKWTRLLIMSAFALTIVGIFCLFFSTGQLVVAEFESAIQKHWQEVKQ